MPPAPISAIWILSLVMAASALLHRHVRRVPLDNALFEIAHIREQRRPGRAEAEYRIFHHRFAAAHAGEKAGDVVVVVAVIVGSAVLIFDVWLNAFRGDMRGRVFGVVFRQKLLLNGFGEGVDGVARLGLTRVPRDSDAVADGHDALA